MIRLVFIALTFMLSTVCVEAMITDDIMIPMGTKSLFDMSTFRLATYVHKPDNFDQTN